ncbi:NUDIX domain-containing protein [Paenibacillus thalictri]|uniref:NUDIX domain-containing protein n=1 Tax=Paenibacillus thalictri TaxID=2527873 RepID=A0A4Q9DBV3_9BACL|nr:NUDIX domain-containing protein [Paenibacillus thalictri]TBL67068.1 NUDIX domain-containing protein [Paenibacillus thalictri]
MSRNWKESYTGQLRSILGNQKLIIPSVRAVIFNDSGEVLYIQRRGNGKWALPAGGIELNESILECLRREVYEETGLEVINATLIAMYTGREYCVKNRFGDEYQGFELLFRVDEWSGTILRETNETTNIGFFPLNDLPSFETGYWEKHEKEVLEEVLNFRGVPIIK